MPDFSSVTDSELGASELDTRVTPLREEALQKILGY